MTGIIKELEKGFAVIVLFFVIGGFYYLNKPEKEIVEEVVPEVKSIYPFEFRAMAEDGKDPILYVTVKNGYLDISPLTNSMHYYKLGRLVYFDDEKEPCGFEMTLTDKNGKEHNVLFHRNRPKFHTIWKYKVHYAETADIETVMEIVKSAKKNIFCYDEV